MQKQKNLRIQIMIKPQMEKQLREHTHRKGDLSKIIEEALTTWLENHKEKT